MKLLIPARSPLRFLAFSVLFASCIVAQNLTVRDIMSEPSVAGMRADGEKLSPDGKKVIFLWNAEGKLPRDLYLVPTSGGTPEIILRVSDLPKPTRSPEKENKLDYGLVLRDDFAKDRENQLGNFEWSPDSSRLLFSHGGDLYIFNLADKRVRRLTRTQTGEAGARFLDNDRIVYSQLGNIFVWNLADSALTQISKEANPQAFVSVFNTTPNKAGTMIAYVVSDSSKQKALVVPNYLDEFVAAGTTRRGWSEQKVMVMPADADRDSAFEIKLPKPEGVNNIRSLKWAADGQSLIIDRGDMDTKRRQLFYIHNVGSKAEQIIPVTEETDDKWLAPLSGIVEPHPKDPSQLIFASERDGFNHLFLAKLERSAPQLNPTGDQRQEATGDAGYSTNVKIEQLTKGPWQVEWAKWLTDGDRLVYASTQLSTLGREFYVLTKADLKVARIPAPVGTMKTNPQLSEGSNPRQILIYSSSTSIKPDELFVSEICIDCSEIILPKQLTKTAPGDFTSLKWNEVKFIDIPSRDGKQIKSKVHLPANFDPRRKNKYPMVIFVHGAGYLQNVIIGWNNYWREFMFNDLLAKKGYVVLDIDYRGSAGYGREWRTDVYDFLGGKDFDDHIDAIDHMVKNYNVNQSKIGVYGGSYGGFMAAMLALRAPERIAAAAALRPVFDWKNYYASSPGYTAQRLGFPDKNPEAYKRSSPISYADKLQRPLLILHGMSDDNVHVQDSVQMMEKLIRLGKTQYFEAMLYPSENHAFVRPESWADEYERILTFFEKHLR